MKIRFLQSGESPDIGVFDAGLERVVPAKIGSMFVSRGIAIEVKEEAKSITATKALKMKGGE